MSVPPPPSSSSDDLDDYGQGASDFQPIQPDPGQKLKRRLLALAGRWYWIALFAIIGFLGAFYYLSKAPKHYTASSSLLIKQQVEKLLPGLGGPGMQDGQDGMNTIAERIRRFDLLEKVASRQDVRETPGLIPEEVDWTPDWLRGKLGLPAVEAAPASTPPPAVLAGRISGWMQVSIRRYTQLIDITVTHPVPEVSAKLADAIAREYLAEIYQNNSDGRTQSIELLERESEKARSDIEASSGALATYERSLELHKALDAKETDFNLLRQRYLPKHPRMASAATELDGLKRRFLDSFDVARNSPNDEAYWAKAAKDLPDPNSEPDDYLITARQLLLSRVGVLESEIDSAKTVFNTMLDRIKDIGVQQEAGDSSAEINSFARVPGPPSGPNRQKILAAGTMGGLACGLLLALLLGWLDNKFHTVAQVASETGAGVLAAIAHINTGHLHKASRAHFKRSPDTPHDAVADWHDLMLFRPGTSATSYAEMFRVLRASVSLLGDETRRKVTLFTSALPGEGKSSISANFALASASQGKKTLLIDFDLRKPSIHKLFGLTRSPEHGGLTDYLANQAPLHEVLTRVEGQPNLHVLVSGNRAPNPGELLDTTKIKALLTLACRHYDAVILDTAPLLSVPDTRILAPLAHNICLVVRAEYTRKGAVNRALKVLDEDRTPLSGVVVNGYKEKRRLIGENYSYGYYGNSGSGSYGSYGTYGTYGADDEEEDRPVSKRRKRKQSA